MTVYLIHFDRPIGNLSNSRALAQHYLGSAQDLDARIKQHASGSGSALMREIGKRGIPWQVVRLWEGQRKEERSLKRLKNSRKLCPLCNGEIDYIISRLEDRS